MRPQIRQLLVALPVVLLALHPIDSADIWFHLQSGAWIASHGAVPRADVFAAAPRPWIVHDWLAGLVFYLLHRLAGAPGLVLLATCLTAGALLLPLSRAGPREPRGAYQVALLLAAGIAYERFFVRPELFSLAGAALWTHVLSRGGPRRGREMLGMVLLQVAWTNLHGAFLLGPVLAALAAAGDLLERLWRREARRAAWNGLRLALPVACLAACCVTPYGGRLLAHIVAASRDLGGGTLRAGIVEWQPTFSQPVPGDLALTLFVVSLVAVGAAAFVARRFLRGFDLLAVLALTLLACTARRQLALYAVAVPALAARWLAAWWSVRQQARATNESRDGASPSRARDGEPTIGRRLPSGARLVPAGLAVVWSVGILHGSFYAWAGPPRSVGWGIASGTHPLGAGGFVASHNLQGPVFNNIAAGSYLIWQLHGRLPVLVDGRLLDPAQFRVYRRCLESPPAFDAWAAAHEPQLVVLALQPYPPERLFRHLDASPAWRLVFFDGTGAVFVTEAVGASRGLTRVHLETALPAVAAPLGGPGAWYRRCDPGEAAVRGRTLLQLGYPAAAASDLERALMHCTERWDLGRDLAAAWAATGRCTEAEPLVRRALRHDPADADAWLLQGACRAEAGDAPGARAAWQRAARLRPHDGRAAQLLRSLPQ